MSEYQEVTVERIALAPARETARRLALNENHMSSIGTGVIAAAGLGLALGRSVATWMAKNSNRLDLGNRGTRLATGAPELLQVASVAHALGESDHALLGALTFRRLSTEDRNLLDRAKGGVPSSRPPLLSQREALELRDRLGEAVRAAHEELGAAEREVVVEKTVSALSTLGYETRIKHGSRTILVRGRRRDLSVAAEVNARTGQLRIDMGGFEHGTCSVELDRLHL